jgi:hypothetical protein
MWMVREEINKIRSSQAARERLQARMLSATECSSASGTKRQCQVFTPGRNNTGSRQQEGRRALRRVLAE